MRLREAFTVFVVVLLLMIIAADYPGRPESRPGTAVSDREGH